MKPHPIAALFPPLPEDEFAELREDIRANGQRDPITVWKENGNEWIVDGCSRHSVCNEIGAPVAVEYEKFNSEADVFAFVMSKNMRRRHMNTSQRSVTAASLADYYAEHIADANLQNGSEVLNQAAKSQGVSPRSAASGKALKLHGVPELVALVEAGELAVNPAELVAKGCKPDEQRALVQSGAKAVRKRAAEIREQRKKQKAAEKALKQAEAQAGVKPAEDAAPEPAPEKPRRSLTIGADKPQGRDAVVEPEPEPEPEVAPDPEPEQEVELEEAVCRGPDCGLLIEPDQCIRADVGGSRAHFCSLACLLGAMLNGESVIDIEIVGADTAAGFLAALDIPESKAAQVRDALNSARVG